MAGSSGTREIATRYPVDEGLTAGTTKIKDDNTLKPEVKSLIRDIDKVRI